MAKCAVCGKGAHFGNNVSHSHRRSNRMWKSNIKRVNCKANGTPKKLYVCASCLKSGKLSELSSDGTAKAGAIFYRCFFLVHCIINLYNVTAFIGIFTKSVTYMINNMTIYDISKVGV